jgi:hypothetical protein
MFSAHATDLGSDDLTFTWTWGYAGFADSVNVHLNNPPITDPFPSTDVNPRDVIDSPGQIYGDYGKFNVTLTVTDDDGGFNFTTSNVTVNNVSPTIDPLAPLVIDEGDMAIFSAHATDPGSDDLTFTWNWGYSGFTDTVNLNLSDPPSTDPYPSPEFNPRDSLDSQDQQYGDDGFFDITLTVTDDDGAMNITITNVTVNNVAPSGNISGPDSGYLDQPIDFTGNGIDPGSDDLTFTWDWGDGSSDTINLYYNSGATSDTSPSPLGTFPFTIADDVQHTYDSKGSFTVTLNISDDDGGFVIYSKSVNITSAPPVVSDVQVTPDPQTVGDEVTISAVVTRIQLLRTSQSPLK